MSEATTSSSSTTSSALGSPTPDAAPNKALTDFSNRWMSMPAWLRWSLTAAIAVLVLAVAQLISGTDGLTTSLASQTALKWSMPVVFAGIGGLFSERAGIVNIGLEGMMIMGTWFAAWGAYNWGPVMGLVLAMVAGAIGGLIHAVVTVHFGVDQIVSGVAINILAPGLTRYLSERVFINLEGGSQTQSPRVDGLGNFTMPFLAGGRIGSWRSPDILGSIEDSDIFFISDAAGLVRGLMLDIRLFTIMGLLLCVATAYLLWRTRFGLRLRTSGEAPKAGESLGVNIYRYRYAAVAISGALAGMAGGFIVLELTQIYRGGQTNGRGFIALAALIFGNWKASGVLAGAMLFSYPLGLSFGLGASQTTHALLLVVAITLAGVAIWSWLKRRRNDAIVAGILGAISLVWYLATDEAPTWLPNTMPFVLVLVVLVFASKNLRMPKAVGIPFRKGES